MNRFFGFSHCAAVGLAFAGAATTIGGCGSLDAKTNTSPPLATLEGTLTSAESTPVTGNVRVAVVWLNNSGPNQFNVAEDLPVQPVFPSSFRIALDGPPPLAAMQGGVASQVLDLSTGTNQGSATTGSGGEGEDGGVDDAGTFPVLDEGGAPIGDARRGSLLRIAKTLRPLASPAGDAGSADDVEVAVGVVVAYLDENGNGQLDLVATGANGYVDKIIGANEQMILAYIQGTIPSDAADSFGHLPVEGYNLFRGADCAASLPNANPACASSAAADAGACDTQQWLTMDTLYPLTVTTNPQVSELMCLSGDDTGETTVGGSGSASGGGPDGGPPVTPQPPSYPSPCDPNLWCAPDGTQYSYATCTTVSNGICEGYSEDCTSATVGRPSPTPAGWPCSP